MASSHKKRTGLRAALIVLLCLVLVCVVAAAVLYSFVSRKIKAFQSGASFALDYTITSTEAEPPALYALLDKYGLRPGDISARTGTGNYVYRILNDERTLGRDTVVAFCLAIGSTLSECQTLLRISRHALLDPRFHRDGALIFALERGIGLSQCNDLLFDIKEDTL